MNEHLLPQKTIRQRKARRGIYVVSSEDSLTLHTMFSMYVAEHEKERAGSRSHPVSEARAMPGNWKQDCKSAESGQEHKSMVTAVAGCRGSAQGGQDQS